MNYARDQQPGEPGAEVFNNAGQDGNPMSYFLAAVALVDAGLRQFYWAHQTGSLPDFITPEHLTDHVLERQPSWSVQTPHWQNSIPEFTLVQHSRLAQLAESYNLTNFELTVVILGCLIAFEPRYHPLFSALPFQLNGCPSLELVLAAFCPGTSARQVHEQRFSASAPLLRFGLIELLPQKTSVLRLFETPSWVRLWLLGESRLPSSLESFTRWLPPLPDGASSELDTLPDMKHSLPLLEIRCATGADSEASLGKWVQRIGTAALWVSWAHLLADERGGVRTLHQLLDIARLWNIVLIFNLEVPGEIKEAMDNRQQNHLETLTQRVTRAGLEGMSYPLCCVLPSSDARFPFPALSRLTISLSAPNTSARYKQLITLLGDKPDWDARQLVQQVALSWHDMRNAVDEALALSRSRGDAVTEADFRQTFLHRARKNFGQLAQRITPQRGWQDIVISNETEDELRDLLNAVRRREVVLAQGFDRKVGQATGISALFYGNPGTGKTLVAEVLAKDLGVDLIRVDLSTVVNKYIGETEKNLGRIFDLAAQDAGVLFFDEADALFGKRSESKDAKDRHANIEVAYLLQRLEQHPGLVILATNNRSHLDDAFTRRLTFITHFLWPDAALRERMWRQAWPPTLRLADDIDFTRLAQVQLTGANIRNIVLQAAWLAATESCVSAAHVNKALKREMNKMGRNL